MEPGSYFDVDDDAAGVSVAVGADSVRFIRFEDHGSIVLADFELGFGDVQRLVGQLSAWLAVDRGGPISARPMPDGLSSSVERRLSADQQAVFDRLSALENPRCCKGGPQWGHALDCRKAPD